jgi:hypothetical protein
VPGENSVYVVNEVDGSVLQKISIPSAFGLDLSVDGTRLFVTSSVTVLGAGAAQGYFVIDASTLHVVDFVQPTIIIPPVGFVPNYSVDNTPRFVAALSNGKVAYSAEETGVTGGSTQGLAKARFRSSVILVLVIDLTSIAISLSFTLRFGQAGGRVLRRRRPARVIDHVSAMGSDPIECSLYL